MARLGPQPDPGFGIILDMECTNRLGLVEMQNAEKDAAKLIYPVLNGISLFQETGSEFLMDVRWEIIRDNSQAWRCT